MENEPHLLIEVTDCYDGKRTEYKLLDRDFKILARAIKLFYIMAGSASLINELSRKNWSENVKDNVSLAIQAEFGVSGSAAYGYVEIARSAYVTPDSILILVDNRDNR